MTNLEKAIEKENELRNSNNLSFNTISQAIKEFGFNNVPRYFEQKKEYVRQNWKPEVFYVDIAKYAEVTEDAIQNGKYGIYISQGEGIHAYHGSVEIDYDLCKKLNVRVVELNYQGGTIIGSAKDFSIIAVFPKILDLKASDIINRFTSIISKYVPNTECIDNDILVNGNKVAGSMTREVGQSFVWATQISFEDYSEYIEKICNKKSSKDPSHIDSSLLTRDQLEEEVLNWLVNKA